MKIEILSFIFRIYIVPCRIKIGDVITFFRPPEQERDRTIFIGISRLGICSDRSIVLYFGGNVSIFRLRKSVDRYERKVSGGYSSI
jgi:hypothetical protein